MSLKTHCRTDGSAVWYPMTGWGQSAQKVLRGAAGIHNVLRHQHHRTEGQAGDRPSVCRLDILPDRQMAGNQVMFGVLWYDRSRHRICLHPYSIITAKEVVRLLY